MGNNFNELFNRAIHSGFIAVNNPEISESLLNLKFNEWLKKNKEWNGEPDTYESLATELNFASFLKHEPLFSINGSLQELIEVYEIRLEQNLILYKHERKERGQNTTIEDENSCKLRTLKNQLQITEQFFSDKYPNGKPKGFNPEIRFSFHWDERKKFKTWLIKEIDILTGIIPPPPTETKTDKLKVPQIALIHVYEGIQITRENAGEIAAKHGYTAKNSGEGLFQDYTNYCSTANRKGKPTPCTPKKLKNKIELFESVVNHLSDNNKQRANDEINILKTIFENEYWIFR